MNVDLHEIYQTLLKHFGHRGWWPGNSAFEIVIGAILTQNTNWNNVEKAIQNLKAKGLLSYKALSMLPEERLAQLIRPSGYYNQKAKKIKAFLHFLRKEYRGSLKRMFAEETVGLREKLLGVKGIGAETADSILLYGGDHLSFVVDLYTYRVGTRHGWFPEEVDYEAMREYFSDRLEADLDLYKDFHAQIVAVGSHYCRKTPRCEECPLKEYLPENQ